MSSDVTPRVNWKDTAGNETTRGPTDLYTPSGNADTALIALVLNGHFNGAPLPAPVGTPNDVAWTQQGTTAWSNADDERRITAFTAPGEDATAGGFTVTYPANDALTYIMVVEVSEVDIAALVLQAPAENGGDSGTAESNILDFAALTDSENLQLMATLVNNEAAAITPGGTWTEIYENDDAGPSTTAQLQHHKNTVAGDVSWTGTLRWGQLGVELSHKEPSTYRPRRHPRRR